MCLAATCAAVWAAVYARREGFSESWRNAIELEFAKRGYHVDIGKLTLGAFRGLVAEDVRLFQDATRTQEFAYIDDVFLDVDLSRILRKQVSVNTLDVQKASLSLPLDPTRPRRLHVTDLSGRIVITESVIEIVKAEASVAGVDLEVKGSLVRPPLGEEKEPAGDPREREAAFNERRRQFLRFLREFETYDFDGARPRVAIEFRGDLHDLATLTATARVAAPAFKKQGQTYQVEGLDALVRFDGRENRAHLEELAVRDAKGLFQATGEWNREANRLDFSATSTADIAGLTGLFWNDKKLGEVVFFTPPAIEATGHLDFDLFPTPVRGFPGELIGEVRAERFVTRGTVFSGAKFGFSLAGERFYLRNLRLDHKTGVAFLNLKYEPGKGDQTIQYQTEIKLDPLVFRPFFDERGRKIIDSWNFGEASSIYIAAVGQGETWKFTSWKNRGVIDLRQFRLNGVDFLELETDYESDGINQWFRNVSLARPEGKIVAEVAQNDRAARTWDVKGVVSTVDLVEGARAFNPKLSKALEKYRHSSPPTIRLAGRLDGRRNEEVGDQPRRNELTVSFSGGGDAQYDFLGKTLTLSDPVGEVVISGSRVHLTRLTASVFGGRIDLRYDVPNVRTPEPPFQMQATVRGVPLERVTRHYGEKGDITGSVDLDLDLSGKVGRIDSFQGGGKARISEGYLFAIPVLGPPWCPAPGTEWQCLQRQRPRQHRQGSLRHLPPRERRHHQPRPRGPDPLLLRQGRRFRLPRRPVRRSRGRCQHPWRALEHRPHARQRAPHLLLHRHHPRAGVETQAYLQPRQGPRHAHFRAHQHPRGRTQEARPDRPGTLHPARTRSQSPRRFRRIGRYRGQRRPGSLRLGEWQRQRQHQRHPRRQHPAPRTPLPLGRTPRDRGNRSLPRAKTIVSAADGVNGD